MYHSGNRMFQRRFGSTALADRLQERVCRDRFSDSDRAFIEGATFFFLATADPAGRPDCSFKGGPAGFVKVEAPNILRFPDYDGNGMFKSLGNIAENPFVGLLFIAMDGEPRRLRVNGKATVEVVEKAPDGFVGAQAVVTVSAEHIFPNCPRYVPDLTTGKASKYTPREGADPVEPAWKSFDEFRDVVPKRRA